LGAGVFRNLGKAFTKFGAGMQKLYNAWAHKEGKAAVAEFGRLLKKDFSLLTAEERKLIDNAAKLDKALTSGAEEEAKRLLREVEKA
jgi:hypothetical protein